MATKYLSYDGVLYFWQKLKALFADKVDKETGKGLSTNDYTTADKNKLAGIANGAEVNVNADWNATSGDAKILNKPTTVSGYGITNVYTKSEIDTALNGKVDTETGKGLSSNDYTSNEKSKLEGIATGAEVNQNAFSNVKVGSTTVAADSKTDTIELAAGTNITLTPDATNDKVTIATSAEVNQNAFSNVKVGSTTVAADSKTDTLELVAGSNITLTPDATNDKVIIAASNAVTSVAGKTGDVSLSKSDVGISDLAQSEATTGTGTTGKLITAKVLHDTIAGFSGVANGFAPLNSSSKIESTYLPSYVDDVVEVYAVGSTPLAVDWLSLTSSGSAITPETGKIYILMATSGTYEANSQFRWGGTAYVKLADGGVSAITNGEIDTILAS